MPICQKDKLAFVHIPKAAGTSIEVALGVYGFNNSGHNGIYVPHMMFGRTFQHMTCDEMKEMARKMGVDLTSYTFFSITRHPAERIRSEFFWRKKWDKEIENMEFFEFCKKFLANIEIKWMNFENRHFVAQSSFVDSNVKMFRQEEDIEDLEKFLGRSRSGLHLQKLNTSGEIDLERFWKENNSALKIIENAYSDDYVKFGYHR